MLFQGRMKLIYAAPNGLIKTKEIDTTILLFIVVFILGLLYNVILKVWFD